MADTNRGERRRIGAMHANIYRQQQELQKQAAKEFAAINNWRYTAKNQALGTSYHHRTHDFDHYFGSLLIPPKLLFG
jgi:hypothetical protein